MESSNPTVDDFLNGVSYADIDNYIPSEFALEFVNFIKLVNGAEGTENKTPPVHFTIIDSFVDDEDVVNLCHRGFAKSTLKEYLILYIGVYGKLPVLGKVPFAIYVSDSIENGVKKMRKSLEYRYNHSDFLQRYIPQIKFTDLRWEFLNVEGNSFVVASYGAKALALDTVLFTEYGRTTIKDVQVGDKVFGSDGKLATVSLKSEVFNRPMYQINLKDGRSLKVCEEHINSVVVKEYVKRKRIYTDMNLTTLELLDRPLTISKNQVSAKGKPYVSTENQIFIKACDPIQFPEENQPIDPYTLGVILGDGRIRKECGSVELTGHVDDFPHYLNEIPYTFGKYQIDKRNSNVRTQSIRGLGRDLVAMKLNVHGNYKFIPEMYLRGSIEQRLALLQGLMDTDGTVSTRKINSVASFTSNSPMLAQGVKELVWSLGGWVHEGTHSTGAKRIQVHLNMPIFRIKRKADRHKLNSNMRVPIISIERIADEPSQCIRVENENHQFIVNDFVRTHNTGVRGTRENNSRPVLALLDDLISDEDAKSPTVIANVEDTVTKAIEYALHPTRRKVIWSGTPFNQKDPLYKAVESGVWKVNAYPVCETFPCEEKEFRGSWEDRFDYKYVKRMYDKAAAQGKLQSFNQELMLRVMSDDDRIILDDDIGWFMHEAVTRNKSNYNFYITTDFATSEKTTGDFSVIAVWAYTNNGDWLLVDGVCNRQLMDQNINDLFRLVQIYRPQSVGVEVTGQQGGFIQWIKNEMAERNNYFNLASDTNGGKEGIRPSTNKFTRFMTVVPLFKAKKIMLPLELKSTPLVREMVSELSYITNDGIKSKKDDCIDVISMLSLMNPWKPATDMEVKQDRSGVWVLDDDDDDYDSGYSSYIV